MAKLEYTDLTYFMIYGYKLVKNSDYYDNISEKKLYLWRYSISSEENREKQNAGVHEISPYDNE